MTLLELLVTGMLMGVLGQGARAIIGLRGMSSDAKALNLSPDDLFEAGRLLTSFLIGILVGIAAALVYYKTYGVITPGTNGAPATLTIPPTDWQTLVSWVASAYAGTDLLESFISQYLPAGAVTPKTKTLDSKVSDLDLKVTSLDTKLTALAQKPPAAPAAIDPETVVHDAFAAMGYKILVSPNTPNDGTKLTDKPFSWDVTDTPQYWSLLTAIATQLYNIDPTLPQQKRPTMADAKTWQDASTTVGNVVTSVANRLAK